MCVLHCAFELQIHVRVCSFVLWKTPTCVCVCVQMISFVEKTCKKNPCGMCVCVYSEGQEKDRRVGAKGVEE